MQIFRDLLPWLNLVPFLPTVLAARTSYYTSFKPAPITESVPDCAAPPTEFSELPFQFWIETVFLKPYTGVYGQFSPSNPVGIFRYYPSDRLTDITYSRAIISRGLFTAFFTLRFSAFENADESPAVIWSIPSTVFPGYNPLVWIADSNGQDLNATFLYFTAVKKCTSKNETELILRASRSSDYNGTYFSRFETFRAFVEN